MDDEQTLAQLMQGAGDPAMMDEFENLRGAQEASLAQHEAYRQRLGQAEAQTVERQSDLAMTSRFYQLLDPNTPKAARSFLYGETAKALGLDPKAATTAEIGKVLTSLDPQSAAAVRTMIGQGIRDATPGDARKMYHAILKGDIPMSDIIQRAQAAAQIAGAEAQQEVSGMVPGQVGERPPGMMRLGGPTEEESATTTATENTPEAARLPPLQRPAPPGLASRFGLDASRPWTMGDLVERGYTGPTDEAGANRMLADPKVGLEARDEAFRGLAGNFARMESIIRSGGKEVLRWGSVRLPFGMGDYPIPTGAELRAGTADQIEESFPDLTTGRPGGGLTGGYRTPDQNLPRNDPSRTGEDDLTARQRFWSRQGAKMLGKELPLNQTDDPNAPATSQRDRDQEARRLTAELEGVLSESVFLIGRLAGQTNQALSDKDRDLFMQQFGSSRDPEARIRVLRDTFARQYDKIVGDRNGVPLDMGALTPDQRSILLNSGIIPDALRNQIQAYNNREAAAQRPPVQQAAAPQQQAAPQAAPQQAAAPEQAPQQAPTQQAAAPTSPESRPAPTQQAEAPRPAAADRPQTEAARPPAGMNRAEREQWLARQRAQEDRQFRLTQMQAFINSELRAQESNERARTAEGRAVEAHERGTPFQRQEIARRQMERAQDKFQAAMSKVASMLAGSGGRISMPRSGGDGGGQDARAFVVPNKPQRQAPRIPQPKKRGD